MRMRIPAFGGLFGGTSELTFDEPPHPLRFEVRPNDDGTIDEVLIYKGAECVFHLEQLDDDHYWFAWYGESDTAPSLDGDRHFDIHRRKKRVEITER